MVDAIDGATTGQLQPRLSADAPPPGTRGLRRSAVLMLFADGDNGPDLLLTGRAATLRSHAGQPAFPGGRAEPGETAVGTALREAMEETGLDPAGVVPAAELPDLYLPPSSSLVTPVLAWWPDPVAVSAVDPAETAVVARVPVTDLADPSRRGRVVHRSGYIGPAFEVAGLVVWGFTAGLVDMLLRIGGWERPWDTSRRVELPPLGAALADPEVREIVDGAGRG
ncbi:NUDIX domain-containing protein [Nakamurella sp. YIM 132087]|uniref:NUDIX domain-containing protein n=2 Tax=Nakamurella alba TaxID=2665158 RepID=A0A7K1FSK0_9ACTN|nr:NUDIX domain-containing protein [Nakamurella alba]